MLSRIARVFERIRTYAKILDGVPRIEEELDALRSRSEVPDALLDEFATARASREYLEVYDKREPLVSVCIATYNRADLLAERSLASVLAQDYSNLDIIVVGDCCTDHTAGRMSAIRDPRVTFVNLPERGRYPSQPQLRWMVAGTVPLNHALRVARGDFVTHLDDDDRYASDRIGKLVKFAREHRADFVWHPFWLEAETGQWILNGAERLASGYVTTSALFYHRWFARIPWDMEAYRFREPGDYNRLRKLKYLGMKAHRYAEPLLWHYRERAQASR